MAHATPHLPHTQSPPPTPSIIFNTPAFIPRAKVITKSQDGMEVTLDALKKHSPQPPTVSIHPASPVVSNLQTTSIHIESQEVRRMREGALRKEQEVKCMRDDALWKEQEAKRMRDDALSKEEEAKRMRDDALWKEEEAKRMRDDALWKDKEAKRMRDDALWKEQEAKSMLDDALLKDKEAKRMRNDALWKDKEARRMRDDALWKEQEAKRMHDDALWKEEEAKRMRDDALWKEQDAKHMHENAVRISNVSPILSASLELVAPVASLESSANRWITTSPVRKVQTDADTPGMVDRKVKALLDELTMEKFDSISDQIIYWANKSVNEKDGRTLSQVIRLVFEKAKDEAAYSEMYARLCRKMMEQINPDVQDDGIKNQKGKPIAGSQLFGKYLLNRCQEDFERGWFAKEAAATAKASATKAVNERKGAEEAELYSDEYWAVRKAERQGLGLIKFIGELFKLQMLTERIMHECVKKLLGNVENPEEEEIESLCQLLKTVGQLLDTPKVRAHMDVYFTRMKELGKSTNVSSRMQFMLQDVLESRERKWVSRNAIAMPTTINAAYEAAAKDRAAEKESYNRQASMSCGGSRRGGERNQEFGPDGWAVAGGSVPRPPLIQRPATCHISARSAKVHLWSWGQVACSQAERRILSGNRFHEQVRARICFTCSARILSSSPSLPLSTVTRQVESQASILVKLVSLNSLYNARNYNFFRDPSQLQRKAPQLRLDDIAIGAPKAFNYMAIMLKGARFNQEPERLRRIASKLMDSDELVSLVAADLTCTIL